MWLNGIKWAVLFVVALWNGGCSASGSSCRESETQPRFTSGSLDERYQRAIAEWREEMRWGEFFGAMASNQGSNKPQLDHLSPSDWTAIYDGMTDFVFDCTWPWLSLHEARRLGAEGSEATKEEFVNNWNKIGPDLHARRVQLAIDIVEKVWKSESADTMKLLEKEFPDERLGGATHPMAR